MNHRFQRQLILGKLLGISGNETLLNPGVVNAQELVLSGGHVDEIRLAIGPLLVQELVHRLVKGSLAEIGANDLVQCLAQVRRARFVVGLLLEMCFPESSTAGSTPAKLTMELRRGNRRTSPIFAISWTAVVSPTPYMARTVSYSGSCSSQRAGWPAWPWRRPAPLPQS